MGILDPALRNALRTLKLTGTLDARLAQTRDGFPNPVVAESLRDRLINTRHQMLMDGPSYRPRKRPGASAPVDNTKSTR
jgi:hypothetical protein